MRRSIAFAVLATSLALAACQPKKSEQELAAERNAAALKEVMSTLGGQTADGKTVNPQQMAAAMAQAGAVASALDSTMTPEERAKFNAITGAIASGQVHPAASAYLAGLDKTFTVISGIKDEAGVNAAKPQLAAIYAEMAGPAAQLKAMSDDDREVAFGSAYAQMMSFGMKMAGVMMPLASNPDLADKVGDLLEEMPEAE